MLQQDGLESTGVNVEIRWRPWLPKALLVLPPYKVCEALLVEGREGGTAMFCEACGGQIADSANFCSACGRPRRGGPQLAVTQASTSNSLSIISFVFAGISLLLFPIVFGPVAVILGVIAWAKGEKLGPVAFAAAILGTIVGMVLGYVIWSGIS